jgi:hypothetical protein
LERKMSRSQVLGLGAAAGLGALGASLVGKEAPALEEPAHLAVSAESLGITVANTAEQNRAALVRELSGFRDHVVFGAGDYLFDNSDEPANDNSRVTVRDFEGRITFLPGARLVFTDPTERGVIFDGGRGAVVEGWNSVFRPATTTRYGAQECVACYGTTDTLFRNCRIDGSASVGLLFGECVRPSVEGATITNTRADGLHFNNCQEARAFNIVTANTGDDGLAFVNYGGKKDYWGATAANIRVNNTGARGISVVGQRGVMVNNFYIDTTQAPGVVIAQEFSYNTRVPRDVRFSNGVIKNAGAVPGGSSPRSGVFLNKVGENVEISDIRIVAPGSRGIEFLYGYNARQVRISTVYVKDADAEGVFASEQAELFLDDVVVDGSGGAGFVFLDNYRVNYGRLVSINTCRKDPSNLAFDFQRNRWILGELLQIEATEGSGNVGARVNASGTHPAGQPQRGIYGRIDHLVERPALFEFTNASNLAGITQAG